MMLHIMRWGPSSQPLRDRELDVTSTVGEYNPDATHAGRDEALPVVHGSDQALVAKRLLVPAEDKAVDNGVRIAKRILTMERCGRELIRKSIRRPGNVKTVPFPISPPRIFHLCVSTPSD
jgi:hypothetical protein